MRLWAIFLGAVLLLVSVPMLWIQITESMSSILFDFLGTRFSGIFISLPAFIVGAGLVVYGWRQ